MRHDSPANIDRRRRVWSVLALVLLLAGIAGLAPPAHADPCVYTIRPDDTLSGIAQRFGTTVQRLALLNDIRNPDLIFVSQRLIIPSCPGGTDSETSIRFPSSLQQSSTDLDPVPEALPLQPGAERLARSAAVRLLVSGFGAVFQGTGSVIGPDGGTLLTAYHVIARPLTGQPRGNRIALDLARPLTAELVEALPDRDLALLRVRPAASATLQPVPVGDSDDLTIGDTVYVIGYPATLEGELSVEGGVIIDLLTFRRELRYIVTDAYAGQGSSGGLAVNAAGELIGIVDALLTDPDVLEALGYPQLTQATVIIPISQAMPLLPE